MRRSPRTPRRSDGSPCSTRWRSRPSATRSSLRRCRRTSTPMCERPSPAWRRGSRRSPTSSRSSPIATRPARRSNAGGRPRSNRPRRRPTSPSATSPSATSRPKASPPEATTTEPEATAPDEPTATPATSEESSAPERRPGGGRVRPSLRQTTRARRLRRSRRRRRTQRSRATPEAAEPVVEPEPGEAARRCEAPRSPPEGGSADPQAAQGEPEASTPEPAEEAPLPSAEPSGRAEGEPEQRLARGRRPQAAELEATDPRYSPVAGSSSQRAPQDAQAHESSRNEAR